MLRQLFRLVIALCSAALTALLAWAGSAVAAAASVSAIGFRDVTTMAVGMQSGCAAGLGRYETTGRARMPLLLQGGAVHTHPVIRVITWGVSEAERAAVEHALVERARRAERWPWWNRP